MGERGSGGKSTIVIPEIGARGEIIRNPFYQVGPVNALFFNRDEGDKTRAENQKSYGGKSMNIRELTYVALKITDVL